MSISKTQLVRIRYALDSINENEINNIVELIEKKAAKAELNTLKRLDKEIYNEISLIQ